MIVIICIAIWLGVFGVSLQSFVGLFLALMVLSAVLEALLEPNKKEKETP